MLHIREFTTLNPGLDTGRGQIYLFPRGKSQQISLSLRLLPFKSSPIYHAPFIPQLTLPSLIQCRKIIHYDVFKFLFKQFCTLNFPCINQVYMNFKTNHSRGRLQCGRQTIPLFVFLFSPP